MPDTIRGQKCTGGSIVKQQPTVRTKQLGHAELRVPRHRRHVTYKADHTIHD